MKITIEADISKIKDFLRRIRRKIENLYNTSKKYWDYFWESLIEHKAKSFIVLGVFIALAFLINFKTAFLFSYFIFFLFFGFDNRFTIAIALVLIIFCPFLLIFKKDALASSLAMWAYYFLIIGVFLLVAEYIKSPLSESAAKESKLSTEKNIQPEHKEEIFSSRTEQKIQIPIESKWKRIVIIAVFFIFIFTIIGFTQRDRISRLIWGTSKTEKVVVEQEEEEPEEITGSTIDKASILIQILNGNGGEESVLGMKDELENDEFKVDNIGEADNYNYTQTVIRYKLGKRDEADLIKDSITNNSSIVLKQVVSGQDYDIIIIVGADQISEEEDVEETVDRSTLIVMVQNGSGYEGAASRMRDKLNIIGYTYDNIEIDDAESSDYENSIVYYRTNYKEQAEQIASDIGGTTISVEEDSILGDTYDILIIVGLTDVGI